MQKIFIYHKMNDWKFVVCKFIKATYVTWKKFYTRQFLRLLFKANEMSFHK